MHLANFFEGAQPYIAMISLQFGYVGMNIITKVSLNRGMSHYVLVTYRQAFATVALAPFAIFLERKVRPKISFPVFMQIFLLGLLGPVIDQNLYYAGLKLTSSTFSCAMSNLLPAITFILALLFRMEKLEIKKIKWQAKLLGTIVTICGAILMTLYKGNLIIIKFHFLHQDWLRGSILLILATLAWSFFFILQVVTLRKYNAPLSLTTLVCFLGTLQSMALTFVMENKNNSVWKIGSDVNLLAAAYAGIVSSSIGYYVQGMVMEKRGPVFVTAFTPLMMIIVAIMGFFILPNQHFHIGSVVGGVLMVMGLYSILWGKHKDYKDDQKESTIVEPVKLLSVQENIIIGKKLPTVIEEEDDDDNNNNDGDDDNDEQPPFSDDIETQIKNHQTTIIAVQASPKA